MTQKHMPERLTLQHNDDDDDDSGAGTDDAKRRA